MGAGGFHGRVRDGIGCGPPAMATRSSNPPSEQTREQTPVILGLVTGVCPGGGGSGVICVRCLPLRAPVGADLWG
jgi:hypothetical protein